jgi:hypothetical protein
LFFKLIKQHLRIKAFFGISENAVKSQIWSAICVYVLVAIIKKRLCLIASLYEILQILSLTLLEKTELFCLFHVGTLVIRSLDASASRRNRTIQTECDQGSEQTR